MRKIEIDDDVFAYLQEQAVAFIETTPNLVLRRLIDIDSHDRHVATSNDSGTVTVAADRSDTQGWLTSQERYQEVIVQALNEMGGRARTKAVLRRIGEILREEHTEADMATYSSGGIRWQARASSEALVLRNRGVLKKDAGRGWWELSDKDEIKTTE